MTTHSLLSPSKRHRWALCPGSIREEKKYPVKPSGPAAIDGTHSHTLFEHCLKQRFKDPMEMVGARLKDHEGEFLIDSERAYRVKLAVDYVKKRVTILNGLAEVRSEEKVNPAWFTHREDLSGNVDCQIRSSGLLEVIDYKDGMDTVEAIGNLQLEQYAIGVLAECKLAWNTPQEYPWREVRLTIIQPKAVIKGHEPIRTWTVDTRDLLKKALTLGKEAIATDNPEAPLVPGDSQCKYCPAKGGCSALANSVMEKVGVMFSPVTNDPLDIIQQSANKNPEALTDEQLRQVIETAPLMRDFLESAEKEAQRRMESGHVVPGLKLVRGRGSRDWVYPDVEMAEKLKMMGVPKSALYVTKFVSPAQAEKLSWEKRDGTKMSLSSNQLERMEREYITKSTGKLTIAPESDSRPAVTVDATSLFSATEEKKDSLPSWLSM